MHVPSQLPAGRRETSHCHCKHASYVRNGLVGGEGDYFFTAYSAFTVRRCEWSDDPTIPSRIVLDAALDNSAEDEELPLATWY